MSSAVPLNGTPTPPGMDSRNQNYLESNDIPTDSSGTAVSFDQTKLHLKPQYKLDINASVNVEESPVTKDLTAKFNDLSLRNKIALPPPQLNFTKVNADDNSWLPTILRDQHPEESPKADELSDKQAETALDIYLNKNDSVVIHSNAEEELNTDERMPDWKRAAIEAKERKSQIQPKLVEFFAPLESNENDRLEPPVLEKDQQQSTVDSSTFNTAFKLFGQHDSFTSDKLNQIIANIQQAKLQDGKPSIELITEEVETALHSSPRKSEFDVTGNKTEDYIKNADALFANLKMRGAPVNPTNETEWKTQNITSITTDSSSSLGETWNLRNTQPPNDEGSTNSQPYNYNSNTTNVDLTLDSSDSEAEDLTHQDSIKLTQNYDYENKESMINQSAHDALQLLYNTTFPSLQPQNRISTPKVKNLVYHKPTLIKPEDFEMKYDEEKKEWIPSSQPIITEEQYNDENILALDAINDLTTISKKNEKRSSSILKRSASTALKPRDVNSKSEVSFRLPSDRASSTSSRNDTFDNKSKSRMSSNSLIELTNVSQIQNISFSESKRKLINVLSTIHPDGEWDDISSLQVFDLDISNLSDFDKIVPNLKSIDLSNNQIHLLDGLPKNMKSITILDNILDNLTSFTSFKNLRFLDISDNSFEGLNSLSVLENLTHLKASNNQINNIDGLRKLESLITVNLSGNKVGGSVNFELFNFPNLQKLDLSDNKISTISGIELLPELIVLKVDENKLKAINCSKPHLRLKKLSLKMNKLQLLSCDNFPYLRVLRIDGNDFKELTSLKKLRYLEEFSLKGLIHCVNDIQGDIRDVSSLDLSGVTNFEFSKLGFFPNVNKLTLSAMNLESLPSNFHLIFPNVRDLNLNFNRLSDLSVLLNLKSLRSLYLVSNALKDLEVVAKALSGSRRSLRKLDLRLNPLNKGFYSYVFSPHESEANQGRFEQTDIPDVSVIQLDTLDDIQSFSIHYNFLLKTANEGDSDWAKRDKVHLKSLKINHSKNDDTSSKSLYIQRLNYEAILLRVCNRLGYFDGKVVEKDDMIDAKIRVHEIFSG